MKLIKNMKILLERENRKNIAITQKYKKQSRNIKNRKKH